MELGIAAGILVFSGVWHLTEWMMAGRNRDTLRLIPFGILYTLLGVGLALFWAPDWLPWVALAAVIIGLGALMTNWGRLMLRGWVKVAYAVIDLAVIAALLLGLT